VERNEIMNALVVYYSQFGNTRQVAEAITGELRAAGEVRALTAGDLAAADLQAADLVVVGAPTHKMNLPEALQPLLEALPRRLLRGTPVAAFDTSYEMSALLARFTAAKKLDRKLRKLGGMRLLPPETFHIVRHHEGPLLDGEIERAKRWADQILAGYERLARRRRAN
jgi:flavodoxin